MCQLKSPTEFNSIFEMMDYFKDEKICLKFIEQQFWGESINCPHCGANKIYRFKDGIRYKCSSCKQPFTLKVGTIFENSKVPLRKWFLAMYLMACNTRGCSTRQLAKQINVTQKTSWYMSHRIRKSFTQKSEKLSGVIQIDECVVGGANGNRHIDKKVQNKKDRTYKDKFTVIGFRSDYKICCEVIKSSKIQHLQPSVRNNIEKGSIIITDEWKSYDGLEKEYHRLSVNHSKRKFLSSEGATTNGVENMWSHLKRMFYGTYNWVSRKHAQRYIDEFVFRFNKRAETISAKFAEIISNIKGALPYKLLIADPVQETFIHKGVARKRFNFNYKTDRT